MSFSYAESAFMKSGNLSRAFSSHQKFKINNLQSSIHPLPFDVFAAAHHNR
jgi:hypothetical protein